MHLFTPIFHLNLATSYRKFSETKAKLEQTLFFKSILVTHKNWLISLKNHDTNNLWYKQLTFYLQECLNWSQSVGIIGGKPNHAYYFMGCSDSDELIYLDPHTTQQYIRYQVSGISVQQNPANTTPA